MKRIFGILCTCLCASAFATVAAARPAAEQKHQLSSPDVYVDVVGDVDGTHPAPQKVLQDTMWIATWTFDTGAPCDGPLPAGWQKGDNHIRTGGNFYEPSGPHPVFWSIDNTYDLAGGISGDAARLGYIDNPCAVDVAGGYSFGWYQGLRIEYEGGGGNPALRFDYLLDSEDGFDFLRVESDSGCASYDRVDQHSGRPWLMRPHSFRILLLEESGLDLTGAADVALTDFGAGTHCVYIAFLSDSAFDPFDGQWPTSIGAALVIDNIEIDDATGVNAITEDFSGGNTIGTFMNMWDFAPFGPIAKGGSWARTYKHITDNDACTENTSCAVLWTDYTTPTIASHPSMAFGPGGYVVKNWLDDVIFSPWVDLSSTPIATGTVLQFRRFGGNNILEGWIVQNWSVRGRTDVDDGMGGAVACVDNWGHVFQWNSLPRFFWHDRSFDASSDFEPTSEKAQLRFRTSDWQWAALGGIPTDFKPGPGPFIDRVRIGRIVLTGPALDEGIDSRFQSQDAFPTEIHPGVTPGTGDHYRPTTDRFGTVAVSMGTNLVWLTPNLVTGDSITCRVSDVRGAGGITSMGLFGAIVSGPHAGKAPPPHTVGANGFFYVEGDSSRWDNSGQLIDGLFFVDLDDEYFVGGDVLHYFWFATDAQSGGASMPSGLSAVPASYAEAQEGTQGMYETSFLPTNNWDRDYLDAVAINNKVDPNSNPIYLDESTQKNCILYYQGINSRRRSGDVNRTSFMYTLDRLGYRGHYDVYDHQGFGNTNNHLGGRATEVQAQGYSLIVYDTGNAGPGFRMPTGNPDAPETEKVDQAGWFEAWLSNASTSECGEATFWLIGSDILEERPTISLYAMDMATSLASSNQGIDVNPDVEGQGNFTFQNGTVVDFSRGAKARYSLAGGCPTLEDYDGQAAVGTGVDVYLYADPYSAATGDAAIVMNANAAVSYNTIMMSHAWYDIREPDGLGPQNDAGANLLVSILGALACDPNRGYPTDAGDVPSQLDAPFRSALHQNRPNPFNPSTTIRFDLARDGHVQLRIYDVAGRWVRTLVDAKMVAARNHQSVWDGMDNAGAPVSSGIYFYRLEAADFTDTHKMAVLR